MPANTTQTPTAFDIAINRYGNVQAVRDLLIQNPITFGINSEASTPDATCTTDATNASVLRELSRRQIIVHTGYNA